MVYAYVRVSTEEQSGSSQKFEITNWAKKNNIEIGKWVEESISGIVPVKKRKLGRIIAGMKAKDMIVSTEISRLGRNMLMIMSVLNDCSQKGIRIHTIKDSFDLTNNINSKIIAFAFALAAEIERNLISQRTKEALADRKAAGVILGRPIGSYKSRDKVLRDLDYIAEKHREGVSFITLAKEYGIHRNTLSRYLKDAEGAV